MRTVGKIGIVVIAAGVIVGGALAVKTAQKVREELKESGGTLFDLLNGAATIGRERLTGAATAVGGRASELWSSVSSKVAE
ncbi:MAG TPA: hypothetical protein VLF59_01915 [Candidatus Saccharimonadales bacterium]|nr:hypothetical protein [Candidatus Saccharimonadales bacterium]